MTSLIEPWVEISFDNLINTHVWFIAEFSMVYSINLAAAYELAHVKLHEPSPSIVGLPAAVFVSECFLLTSLL